MGQPKGTRSAVREAMASLEARFLSVLALASSIALAEAIWTPSIVVLLGPVGGLALFEVHRASRKLVALEVERDRLRDAFTHFGEALAATHDPEYLRRVVVEALVEATGAAGGTLVGDHGELIEAGTPGLGAERLVLPLAAGRSSFGTLTITGPGFSQEARMTAVSLAAHAVVALENARLHRIVERQALVDGLTGLANRRQCETTLGSELARSERFGDLLALVFVDLDGFKEVNDRFGHPAGDGVLRDVATVLHENVREADLAARWGGEEFALVLPGTGAVGAVQLAERMADRLRGRTILAPDGTPIRVTASFGVAAFPEAATAEELVHAADAALYAAKRAGKDRVVCAPAEAVRP
jgi:diguanylate cyclase (GGDEF)-like protein